MKITYTGSDLKFLTAAFRNLPENGHDVTVGTTTQLVARHPVTGMGFTIDGFDMAFVDDNPDNDPISGTITRITFDLSGSTVAVFDDISWSFVGFVAAIDAFEDTDNAFDALINANPVEFDGSQSTAGFDLRAADFTLTSSLTAIGSGFADFLSGGIANDTLTGGQGVDRLFGRGGDDRLLGGRGADYAEGGRGDDRIIGGAGSDVLKGGKGKDRLEGGNLDDELFGGGGGDLMFGGRGSDVLTGGLGTDNIFGGDDNDVIYGNKGKDALHGGGGIDVIFGGGGKDTLFGGDDMDSLRGGRGNDTFFGGAETDDMIGGAGADVFIYSSNATDGADIILDFQIGQDIIRITDGYSFDNVTLQSSGEGGVNTIVTWGATEILMFDVSASSISAADFDFL